MNNLTKNPYTIIYSNGNTLELDQAVLELTPNIDGRVIIPTDFKDQKTIIAVIRGDVDVLNKLGDRAFIDQI